MALSFEDQLRTFVDIEECDKESSQAEHGLLSDERHLSTSRQAQLGLKSMVLQYRSFLLLQAVLLIVYSFSFIVWSKTLLQASKAPELIFCGSVSTGPYNDS